MSSNGTTGAATGRRSRPVAGGLTDPIGPNLTLKSRTRSCKRVDWDIFIDVDSLGMLP